MQGKIFLSGGGNENDSRYLDEIFIKLLNEKATVLYIPHANQKQEKENHKSSLNWFNSVLKNIDSHKQITVDYFKNLTEITDLNIYSAIYIDGGNTYYLMKLLRDSNFDKKLIEYHKNGGTIYGGSAGAIVLGKNIATADDDNFVNLDNLIGLDIMDGFSVKCHYQGEDLQDCSKEKNKTIYLHEKSGVIIQ